MSTKTNCILLQICLLLTVSHSNTAFPDGWRPLPYGECTIQGPTPSLTSAIIYYINDPKVGAYIPDVCGFSYFEPFGYLPKEYLDGYWLFPGQDIYNGFHVLDNFESASCNVAIKSATNSSNDCAQSCGTCYHISGPNGSQTYIVVTVVEAEYMNMTARGLSSVLPSSINAIGSSGDNVEWKRVPCTIDKTGVDNNGGIYIRYWDLMWDYAVTDNLRFWIANHLIEIAYVYLRFGQGATDRSWHRLVRSSWNDYDYDGYSSSNIAWQRNLGNVFGNSINMDFDFKIISVFNEEIVCIGLQINKGIEYDFMECLDSNHNPLQFTNLGPHSQAEYDLSCRDTTFPTTTVPTTDPTTYSPTSTSPTTALPTTNIPTTATPTTGLPTTAVPTTTAFPTTNYPTSAPSDTTSPTTNSPSVEEKSTTHSDLWSIQYGVAIIITFEYEMKNSSLDEVKWILRNITRQIIKHEIDDTEICIDDEKNYNINVSNQNVTDSSKSTVTATIFVCDENDQKILEEQIEQNLTNTLIDTIEDDITSINIKSIDLEVDTIIIRGNRITTTEQRWTTSDILERSTVDKQNSTVFITFAVIGGVLLLFVMFFLSYKWYKDATLKSKRKSIGMAKKEAIENEVIIPGVTEENSDSDIYKNEVSKGNDVRPMEIEMEGIDNGESDEIIGSEKGIESQETPTSDGNIDGNTNGNTDFGDV